VLLVTSSSSQFVLIGAVFLASAVEMVEALTIVVAVGHTQGWRPALRGSAVALASLAALVAIVGPGLAHVPLNPLRVIVGGVLLVFGLQWLRKAILRASGALAKHDEDAIYARTVATITGDTAAQTSRAAFVLAYKGVFLEGLEVIIIVLTLGASSRRIGVAALASLAALLVVGVVGVVVARQLSKVPENTMKMTVGVLLVSYGTFFCGEGLKVRWPGHDASLVILVGVYALVTWLFIVQMRSVTPAVPQ
jgi:Ca2+/H+ antiporter, TMEM165/GDT1 family